MGRTRVVRIVIRVFRAQGSGATIRGDYRAERASFATEFLRCCETNAAAVWRVGDQMGFRVLALD